MIAEVSMMIKVSMMALVTEVSMIKLMTAWIAMMSIIAWWLSYLCYPWSLWWPRCPLVSMMPWWSLWCAGWHWWLWCSGGLDVWEIYDVPIMNLTIVMFIIALMTLKSLVFLKNMTTVMFMKMWCKWCLLELFRLCCSWLPWCRRCFRCPLWINEYNSQVVFNSLDECDHNGIGTVILLTAFFISILYYFFDIHDVHATAYGVCDDCDVYHWGCDVHDGIDNRNVCWLVSMTALRLWFCCPWWPWWQLSWCPWFLWYLCVSLRLLMQYLFYFESVYSLVFYTSPPFHAIQLWVCEDRNWFRQDNTLCTDPAYTLLHRKQ